MSYMSNDSSFDSIFGKAADGINFDKVIDAEEDNALVESVLALDEVSDGNDDFAETQGEDHKNPNDIRDELEGREDDGNNDVTDSLDIDLAAEMALLEVSDGNNDFAETQGEDHKNPNDIKDELEGRDDDGCNRHTGGFNGYNTNSINYPALSMGNYHSADSDLHDIDGATDRAARSGESEYKDGDLSTEMAALEAELAWDEDATVGIIDPDTFESEKLTNEDDDETGDLDDFDGVDDDYTGVDDDFDEVDSEYEIGESSGDFDFYDPEIEESAEVDEDDDLIEVADEDDGELSAAEVDALVAAGGDDDLLDSM